MLMRNCSHLQGEAWLSLMPTDSRACGDLWTIRIQCLSDACVTFVYIGLSGFIL